MSVAGKFLYGTSNFSASFFFSGKKPIKENLDASMPESMSAGVKAVAPGTAVNSMPAAISSRVKILPGSETSGVPASVMSATDCPDFNRSIIFALSSISLNLW